VADIGTPRNAIRRVAKSLLEWDRLCHAYEYDEHLHLNHNGGQCDTKEQEVDGNGNHSSNYYVGLTKLEPLTCTPKNDVLFGLHHRHCSNSDTGRRGLHSSQVSETHSGAANERHLPSVSAPTAKDRHMSRVLPLYLRDAQNDVRWAMEHLQSSDNNSILSSPEPTSTRNGKNGPICRPCSTSSGTVTSTDVATKKSRSSTVELELPEAQSLSSVTTNTNTIANENGGSGGMEWTSDEAAAVQALLDEFMSASTESKMQFPPGQGPRIRKIQHYLADQLHLKHWSSGKQGSKRAVHVEKVPQK
jgi:hypothetical protein